MYTTNDYVNDYVSDDQYNYYDDDTVRGTASSPAKSDDVAGLLLALIVLATLAVFAGVTYGWQHYRLRGG